MRHPPVPNRSRRGCFIPALLVLLLPCSARAARVAAPVSPAGSNGGFSMLGGLPALGSPSSPAAKLAGLTGPGLAPALPSPLIPRRPAVIAPPEPAAQAALQPAALPGKALPVLKLLKAVMPDMKKAIGPASQVSPAAASVLSDFTGTRSRAAVDLRPGSRPLGAVSPEGSPVPDEAAFDALLDKVDAIVAQGRTPTVALDLDDTLFKLDIRKHHAILKRYVLEKSADPSYRYQESLPALKRLLHGIGRDILETGDSELLRADFATLFKNVAPADPRGLITGYAAFWSEHYFDTGDPLDRPRPSAPEYVAELERRGALIVYVTARLETMEAGTLRSLEKGGFPVPGQGRPVRLFMKPKPAPGETETPTPVYKNRILSWANTDGRVLAGGVEDNPRNAAAWRDFCRKHGLRAEIILLRGGRRAKDLPSGIWLVEGFPRSPRRD